MKFIPLSAKKHPEFNERVIIVCSLLELPNGKSGETFEIAHLVKKEENENGVDFTFQSTTSLISTATHFMRITLPGNDKE